MNHSRPQEKKWSAPSVGESCSRCRKCLTKMQLVLLAALLYSTLTTGCALQLLRLDVPSIADPRWEKITLTCEYDLGGEDLYSVKWYKDGDEFFRFMPGSKPPGRDFPVEGVDVDVSKSDSKRVTLLGQANNRRGKINLAGSYGCEVSSEGPNFLTTYGEANMSVAVPPKMPPVLDGVRPYYEVGEILEAECTSAPSYPPALLSFILNGREVNKRLTNELPSDGHVEGNIVSTTRLGLRLRLERPHFPGGTLSLTCQSSLPGIPSARALRTEEIATLAANNQRLAQEPPGSGSRSSFYSSLTLASLLTSLLLVLHYFHVPRV